MTTYVELKETSNEDDFFSKKDVCYIDGYVYIEGVVNAIVVNSNTKSLHQVPITELSTWDSE